jgi:head-tail adaptor
MRAGKLRQRGLVYTATRSTSSSGMTSVEYVSRFWINCEIKSIRGGMVETFRLKAPSATNVINCVYVKDINEDCKIEINNVMYDIDFVDNVMDRNRYLEILIHEQGRY